MLLISRALSLGGWSDVWIQQKKFRAKTGRIRRRIENVNVDVITISPDNIWTLLVWFCQVSYFAGPVVSLDCFLAAIVWLPPGQHWCCLKDCLPWKIAQKCSIFPRFRFDSYLVLLLSYFFKWSLALLKLLNALFWHSKRSRYKMLSTNSIICEQALIYWRSIWHIELWQAPVWQLSKGGARRGRW